MSGLYDTPGKTPQAEKTWTTCSALEVINERSGDIPDGFPCGPFLVPVESQVQSAKLTPIQTSSFYECHNKLLLWTRNFCREDSGFGVTLDKIRPPQPHGDHSFWREFRCVSCQKSGKGNSLYIWRASYKWTVAG